MNPPEPEERAREVELRARIAAASGDVEAYLELANLLKAASRFEEAARVYEQGLLLPRPNSQKARLAWELGSLFDKVMDRSTEAVTLAQRALGFLTSEPDSPETVLLRGLSHSLLAQAVWFHDEQAGADAATRAIEWLERAIKEHDEPKDVAVAYGEAAWAYTALGHHDRTIALCQEHLRHEPDPRHRLVVLMTLAEGLRLAGRFSEAEDVLMQALDHSRVDPLTRPVLYVTLGLIRRETNRTREAQWAFEQALQALRLHPFRSEDREHLRTIFGNLAHLHYEAGDLGTAIGMFEQLLTQYPEDGSDRHRILNWLGRSHADLGAHTQARRYYEQVLASPIARDEDRTDAQEGLTALPSSH